MTNLEMGEPFWRRHRAILLLIAFALVVRVGFVFAVEPRLVADPADYHRLGVLVADGGGFGESPYVAGGGATAVRPPGLPAFLAAVYTVFGDSVTAGRLALAVLGAVAVALIAAIAYLLFGRRVALIATAFAAVYPPLVLVGGNLLSEALFLCFELGALLAALYYRRRPDRIVYVVVAGVCIGLAALTRTIGIAFIVPVALLLFIRGKEDLRRALVAPVLAAVLAAAVIAPWTIRNLVAMDSFIVVSNEDAFLFAGVFNDSASKGPRSAVWRPVDNVPEYRPILSDPSLTEAEVAHKLRDGGLDYLKEHPAYGAKVVVKSTLAMFDLLGPGFSGEIGRFLGYDRGLSVFQSVTFWIVGLLAIGGAFTRAARRAPVWFWITPFLILAASVTVVGTWRYRSPLEPFFLLAAALAIDYLLSRTGAGPEEPEPARP